MKWKCSNCGYSLDSEAPPENCPSCKESCAFVDATCYTPYCGGPDNPNDVNPDIYRKER